MAKIDKNELSMEMVQKALKCETADELIKLAESEGYEITKDEAEAYLQELSDIELDEETLKAAAGGLKACYIIDGCAFKCGMIKEYARN